MSSEKFRKRIRSAMFLALIAVFSCAGVSLAPSTVCALKIELEESPEPPKGVEIIPDEELNPVKPVEQPPAAQPAAEAAPAPAPEPAAEAGEGKDKYRGIFNLWEPMKTVFPLKTATIGIYGINLLKDQGWMVNSSRYTGFTNYFIQGGRSYGILKDFTGTFQFNRQSKNQIITNQVMNLTGKLAGIDLLFDRNYKSSTSGTGANTAMNKVVTRKYSAAYSPSDRFSLGWASDENLARNLNPGSQSKTINRKQTWTLKFKPSETTSLTATRFQTANWDYANNSVVKTTQADVRLTRQYTGRFSVDYGYQFIGNRNITGNPATSSESHKSNRLLEAKYQLSQGLQLNYLYTFVSERNQTSAATSKFGITNREYQLRYDIFPWLKFDGKNQASFSESSGKTAQRQAVFVVDHGAIFILPGATTVQMNKNVKLSGSGGDSKMNVNYTLSASTPLNYFENRLSVSRKYTLNEQRNSEAASETNNRSVSLVYSATYKPTNSFSISKTLNTTESTNMQAAILAGLAKNVTDTVQLNYQIRMPFTRDMAFFDNLMYTISRTDSQNKTVIPATALTLSDVIKHSGVLSLKGAENWNASYTLERSIARSPSAAKARALSHKLNWDIKDFLGMGYKFIGNYSITLQSQASVSGGIFKLLKERGMMTSTMGYEFSKNQDEAPGQRLQNTMNRYYEAGMEFKY